MSKSVEIDDELFASLERLASSKGASVGVVVEQALRAVVPAGLQGRFTQRVHDFGGHLESPWTVLSEIESDAYTIRQKK